MILEVPNSPGRLPRLPLAGPLARGFAKQAAARLMLALREKVATAATACLSAAACDEGQPAQQRHGSTRKEPKARSLGLPLAALGLHRQQRVCGRAAQEAQHTSHGEQ